MIKQESLIRLLNPKIRGWANYHRHIAAKKTFSYVDYHIYNALQSWCKRRHPKKGKWWINKYFTISGTGTGCLQLKPKKVSSWNY